MRIQINKLLDWHGVPTSLGDGKAHHVTYADILRDLEPYNEGRAQKDRITYDSLWNHAKRHYEIDGIATYWNARIKKDFRRALTRRRRARPIEK